MFEQVTVLEDDRVLKCLVTEILAVPYYDAVGYAGEQTIDAINGIFFRLVSEVYHLCPDECVAIEFLLISEPVRNQALPGRVRLFSITRQISDGPDSRAGEPSAVENAFRALLRTDTYPSRQLSADDFQEFEDLLSNIKTERINALIKLEKCPVSEQSVFPYYHCDIIAGENKSFDELLYELCQEPHSAISFQLIPTAWSDSELYLISQMTASLEQISGGTPMGKVGFYKDILAEAPYKVYSYYANNSNKPLFKYNILIFGRREACASLTAKTANFLQQRVAGQGGGDLTFVDLTEEHLHIKEELAYYPWNINNKLVYTYRNHELWQQLSALMPLYRLPYLVTAEEAAVFFRLPVCGDKTPGLNRNQSQTSYESFKPTVIDKDNIQFGLLKGTADLLIGCSPKAFTKHALIVGTPGTGKTTFSLNLLLQFYKKGIPFLAIEPTKTEYRALIDAIPDLQIFTPGNNTVSPYIINPFVPPKGIRLEQYLPSLAGAFKAAFSMPSPLDIIFLSAIRKCYTAYGWKNNSKAGDDDVQPFGLYEFILVFKRLVEQSDYSREVRGNIQSGGTFRLMNVIEQNSDIYDTIHTVPIEDLLSRPTVLELNSIDNAEQKALIMALLLINICVFTKHNQSGNNSLKNAILVDEAHVILGGKAQTGSEGADSQGTTIKALQDMIAEIRSFGTGIIIADQSPSKVSREVIANTDIKIAFRLVQSEEKSLISDSTNMDDTMKQQLSRLGTGEAYAYYNMLYEPQLITTTDVREAEGIRLSVPDSEVQTRMSYWDGHQDWLKPHSECQYCETCKSGCELAVRGDADYYASKIIGEFGARISDREALIKYMHKLHELVIYYERGHQDKTHLKRLCNCTKIKLLRKVLMEKTLIFTRAEIKQMLAGTLIKER